MSAWRLGVDYRMKQTGSFVGAKVPYKNGCKMTVRIEDVCRFKANIPANHLEDIIVARGGDKKAIGRLKTTLEEIESASKIELPEMIDNPELSFKVMKGVINPASLLGGRARAEELNQQNPGRKFRVPTEAELLKLNKEIGGQLEGKDLLIWTETEHEDYPGNYVLRRLRNDYRDFYHPEDCCSDFAVRFVEDK